jgi:tyrosyl-tRNA synthetase
MKKNLSQKIKDVLEKGVEEILSSREELFELMQKRKIRLYLGVDPTSSDLHLGHAIPLRKLREFQDLGHETILLFGTFTAQIGDPSGRDEKRKPLSLEQVEKNILDYKAQASKIIDFKKTKIMYNGDWLSKLNFGDLAKLTSHFTVSRLLERDMFQRRLGKKEEVWVNEFLYPLMQGYDSVAMNVDLEIGGGDQKFNMLVGRKLQRIYNNKEKFVLTTPMLLGLDGRKMSKTYGNTINLRDSADEMYGKIMSLRDDLITKYFELVTDISLKETKELERDLKLKKINPKIAKDRLAEKIITTFHGKKAALAAGKEFEKVFTKKKLPSLVPEVKIKRGTLRILDLLTKTKLVSSRSEAKRLIMQKGVKINGEIIEDWGGTVEIRGGEVVQIGRRRFAKLL